MQFRCGFGAVLAQFWVGGTAPFFFGKNMVFIQTCSFGKWIIFSKTWLFHTHDDFYFGLMDFLSKFFKIRIYSTSLACTTAPFTISAPLHRTSTHWKPNRRTWMCVIKVFTSARSYVSDMLDVLSQVNTNLGNTNSCWPTQTNSCWQRYNSLQASTLVAKANRHTSKTLHR